MQIKENTVFISKSKNVVLDIISKEEIHIGTFMWRFSLKVNNKEVENIYIGSETDYLESNLNNYQFESIDARYLFFPNEQVTIYDVDNNVFYSLYKQIRDKSNSFIGNIFFKDKLIVIHEREFFSIDLDKKETNSIVFFGNQKIIDFHKVDNDEKCIILEFNDASRRKIKI